jgi:hypothetical protein
MRPILVAGIVLMALCGSSKGQERTLSQPPVIHTWLATGSWPVSLVKHNGGLACLLATGDIDAGYFSGLGEGTREDAAIFISDRNPEAIRGLKIEIIIDSQAVGWFDITSRWANHDGSWSIFAPPAPCGRIQDSRIDGVGVLYPVRYERSHLLGATARRN